MSVLKLALLLAGLAAAGCAAGCARPEAGPPAVTYVDGYTLRGPRNFITGYETRNPDGTYNMVVEIPTGTHQKWEICKTASLDQPEKYPGCTAAGREMVQEVRDGARRVISYLGYPGNYGSLPKTLAEDGDPLDVIAIGPPAERGAVIAVRVVGVIRCVDGGEQDDKVVAVTRESPLHGRVSTAAELEAVAPKAAHILFSWFTAYKGADVMTCSSMVDETVAAALIAEARAAFMP